MLTKEVFRIVSFESFSERPTSKSFNRDSGDWHILTGNDQRIISHNLNPLYLLFLSKPPFYTASLLDFTRVELECP